jgi:two-component system response regulator GlrR
MKKVMERARTLIFEAGLPSSGALEDDAGIRELIRTRDPAMDPVLRRILAAARYDSNVVVTGESGTGKELVARALHQCGPRHSGPFVALNCAAVPDSLLESDLFGHVRGAFTDARADRPGLFSRAHGGTLFLDEIGDASPAIQVKLLRVLQEREFVPLGGRNAVRVDFRLVAATHRSLADEIARGSFREDLFYRLHVIGIRMPPLRERREDVLHLATVFALQLAKDMRLELRGITAAAQILLENHHWPGNVRELQNRIEHALVLSHDGWITPENVFPDSAAPGQMNRDLTLPPLVERTNQPDSIPTFAEAKRCFEQSYLSRVLSAARGNITQAAKLASKSRTEIYCLLRKHGLDPVQFKSPGQSQAAHSRGSGDGCDAVTGKVNTEFQADSGEPRHA